MTADAGANDADEAGGDIGGQRSAQSCKLSDAAETSNARTHEPVTPAAPDLNRLAQDWITLWQSELAAMAADPELRESWQALVNLWSGTMSAMVRAMPSASAEGRTRTSRRYDDAERDAEAVDAPRTAATAATPDTRDAEVERLACHIALLERRLADLERRNRPQLHPRRDPKRKSRK